MIIQKVEITKFRGFENVEFHLGSQLTIIAGQNGTQKTTILGVLSQPFTITEGPMKDERPMSGGSFKSAFAEKFKFSDNFDKAKTHEWTLHLANADTFTIESIPRGGKEKGGIRFWRKGDRSKGSGYIQLPVIFLSLKRLIPIGEDAKLAESRLQSLTKEEETFFKDWHKKILISQDEITNTNYLESPDKNTLGINTNLYDWRQNSAGQDNIGKILLAILSFKRLKEKYPNHYTGGILAIDELDATIYPGSQIKLLEALRKFASNFKIQIIFTTHSLSIIEKVCVLQEQNKNIPASKEQIKVVFLEKRNSKIEVIQDVTYNTIKHRLNVTIEGKLKAKIMAFVEDKEAAIFVKALLKQKSSKLKFIDCTFSYSSLIELSSKKVPAFIFPNSIIFLDGDVKGQSATMKKIKGLKNFVILPTSISPERLLAEFLNNIDDNSRIWASINPNFTKQYCFKEYTLQQIQSDRSNAKLWFNSHLKDWGKNATKVINPWINMNKEESNKFVEEFVLAYNKFAKELSIETF